MTIYEIMRYIRNFFPVSEDAITGQFTVSDGTLLGHDLEGFVLIEGSRFNDGVCEFPTHELRDETFTGLITPLAPPADFLQLCRDIITWDKTYREAMHRPFKSESFDGYSYTMDAAGDAADWRRVWASELNPYRRI